MKTKKRERFGRLAAPGILLLCLTLRVAQADQTAQTLPLVQNWTDAALITADNDWSKVPGFMGYRGEKLSPKPGANPQMIISDGTLAPASVLANQSKPNALRTGGVAEFDGIPDPVIALKGSATASAPFLLLNLDTLGKKNIAFGYKLRDLEASANDAVQPVAFQYRVGTNGNFIDLPGAFVPDASTGPGLATLVTPVVVVLPAVANDQPLVQVRWITANAEGNDEWIGIAAITVIGEAKPAPATTKSSAATETKRPVKALRSPRDPTNPDH